MPRRITEPELPKDAMSPGDTAIGHAPGSASFYRNTTSWGQPRPGVPGYDSQPTVEAPEQLPMLGVARQVAGRELGRLRDQAAGLEKDLQRGVIGMNGGVVPHLAERQREAREALEATRARIAEIEHMADDKVRQLAYELGAR